MAFTTLRDAAAAIRGVQETLEQILTEAAPLQMAYFEERAVMLATSTHTDRDEVQQWLRTGYGPFFDAVSDLIGLLESVEEADNADSRRRFEEMPR